MWTILHRKPKAQILSQTQTEETHSTAPAARHLSDAFYSRVIERGYRASRYHYQQNKTFIILKALGIRLGAVRQAGLTPGADGRTMFGAGLVHAGFLTHTLPCCSSSQAGFPSDVYIERWTSDSATDQSRIPSGVDGGCVWTMTHQAFA